ncbi:hypothetical protein [Mucilaginibacter pedocola]|uniref:Lipoprotein n=1 Tax=Mucilaginibacter pedocola TaxID=1792845 RepID=A0A1S9P8S9_9SPHI|nr:hypothetical protein [Mucilaginibacter pedocola]OOQ57028.1 hypothetical protein BC343_15955 [Mucilaginibacter pedocola]
MKKTLSVIFVLAIIAATQGCLVDIDSEYREAEYNGKIIIKNQTGVGCFGSMIIRSENHYDTIRSLCYCVPRHQDIWSVSNLGDSIFKKKGEMVIYLKKDKKKLRFNYPVCHK